MNEILQMYPKQHEDVASRVIEGEAIVLTPQNGMLHTFNSVGTRIWEFANGKRTVASIIQKLSEEFDAEEKKIREDAIDFIEDLVHKKMFALSKKPT